jgi:hypothetical protein
MTFKMTKLLTTSLVVLMLGAAGAQAQDAAATSSSTDTTSQSTTTTTTDTATKPMVHHRHHHRHHPLHKAAMQQAPMHHHMRPVRQTTVRTTHVMATRFGRNADMNGTVEVIHHPYVDDSWSVLHGMNDHSARWFFYQADRNHDGELDFGEFESMVAWKYPAGDIRPSKKFAAMDENQDGLVSYQEFMHNYDKPYTQALPIHWVPNGARGDNDDE